MSLPSHTDTFRVLNNPRTSTGSLPGYHGAMVIDLTCACGEQEWENTPVRHLTSNYDVKVAATRFPGIDRYCQIKDQNGKQVARYSWGKFSEAHFWFRIPKSIPTARTFLHDVIDVYSIDTMHRFLKMEVTVNWDMNLEITNEPFIAQGDTLLGRCWNRFQLARNFQKESRFWDNHRAMAPSNTLYMDLIREYAPCLCAVYPPTLPWYAFFIFRPASILQLLLLCFTIIIGWRWPPIKKLCIETGF